MGLRSEISEGTLPDIHKNAHHLNMEARFFAVCRSHDGYVEQKNGFLEASPGSRYASQRTVFNDLGRGVLENAFEGKYKGTSLT